MNVEGLSVSKSASGSKEVATSKLHKLHLLSCVRTYMCLPASIMNELKKNRET